ncbi:MAG: transglutaminase family protein [Proteobacteria bacterium]|nr:transglutaminase family protein [Pseudomonadota bacterium]
MRLTITHRTAYDYESPVLIGHNVVRLRPRDEPHQRCHAHLLTVEPRETVLHTRRDFFGNTVGYFTVAEPHRQMSITALSTVELWPRPAVATESSPPWEQVRQRLQRERDAQTLTALAFVDDSPRIRVSPELRAYAEQSFTPGRPIVDGILALTRRMHTEFAYDKRATTVTTAPEEVFRLRRGVCQDLAHVQIACLRALGLAARYVSGYLRTRPRPGQARLIGADASHAWVGVYCGDAGWIDVDPTNDVLPALDHVTVAWGRDYGDVSPIAGIYVGGDRQTLKVAVEVTAEGEGATERQSASEQEGTPR